MRPTVSSNAPKLTGAFAIAILGTLRVLAGRGEHRGLGGPWSPLAAAMHSDHGLAQRDVVQGIARRRGRSAPGAHAVVEVDELLFETLLIGDDLLGDGRARRMRLSVLRDQAGGHAAEKGGR